MPLKPTPKKASKKTRRKIFSENVRAEMEAGKPQKQAVAIAYAKERRRKNKRGRKMTRTHT